MHTKGKWRIDGGTNEKGDMFIWLAGEYYGGHAIATVHEEIQEGSEANAKRICKCVNEYDELVEKLESIKEYWNQDENPSAMSDALWEIMAIADKAINMAEGD